jgi:hypothetical protein
LGGFFGFNFPAGKLPLTRGSPVRPSPKSQNSWLDSDQTTDHRADHLKRILHHGG